MARISGVDLPNAKRVEVALTYIFGIGDTTAKRILASTGINPDTRVKELAEDEVIKIRRFIEKNLIVEGDLRRDIQQNIKRLMDINTYAGYRHKRGLPVRGQRTRTNGRTRKGPRRAIIKNKASVTK
jgi:small subunit ribosomal protein S13